MHVYTITDFDSTIVVVAESFRDALGVWRKHCVDADVTDEEIESDDYQPLSVELVHGDAVIHSGKILEIIRQGGK